MHGWDLRVADKTISTFYSGWKLTRFIRTAVNCFPSSQPVKAHLIWLVRNHLWHLINCSGIIIYIINWMNDNNPDALAQVVVSCWKENNHKVWRGPAEKGGEARGAPLRNCHYMRSLEGFARNICWHWGDGMRDPPSSPPSSNDWFLCFTGTIVIEIKLKNKWNGI